MELSVMRRHKRRPQKIVLVSDSTTHHHLLQESSRKPLPNFKLVVMGRRRNAQCLPYLHGFCLEGTSTTSTHAAIHTFGQMQQELQDR
eukprot:2743121-Amphidinium_carterae.1